ncbi:MAG: hypothetical protein WC757_00405 [Candidatus Paceibacterota bacterium]|jgi:hypothetical protein
MTAIQQNGTMPFLVWDIDAMTGYQAQYLVETGVAADAEEGYALASADSDLIGFEWENLTGCLGEALDGINPNGNWYAEVENFGWQKRSGTLTFEASDARTFLSKILPATDCTFKVFLGADNTLCIQNFHHDSPTGNEWYTIRPATET